MTTNNHPANGPVSLDRLHQISEILSKAAAQSDGGNLGYAMADAVKVIDGAIAAFGAEPAGYADPLAFRNFNTFRSGETDNKRMGREWMWANPDAGLIPLYTSPPAPVVPDEIDVNDPALDTHRKWMAEGWNRCRAVMLQAGNSPATPDGWIPVIERMPEGSEEVLCTKEFDGPGDWRKKVGYWHEGKWVVYGASWTPTHWMPLPAAPQQEVKS